MTKSYPYVTPHLAQFYIYFPATQILIPWSRVLLEKLTGFQLVKKFPAFYGTPVIFFVLAVSEVTHCEMLNFYCNLGITANFHRFSELLRFLCGNYDT
jgi:hypothetical protein